MKCLNQIKETPHQFASERGNFPLSNLTTQFPPSNFFPPHPLSSPTTPPPFCNRPFSNNLRPVHFSSSPSVQTYSSASKGALSRSSLTTPPRWNGSRPKSPGTPTISDNTNRIAPMVNAKIHWSWKIGSLVRNWPTPVAIVFG